MTDSPTSMFTVVVLNWNGRALLEDCLTSLRSQTFKDFEVIVVDNGSTDQSVQFIQTNFPDVHIIELSENLGFCGGNNIGIANAHGSHIFLLNNDTEVPSNLLSILANVINESPIEIGFWATTMVQWQDRSLVDNCGCGYADFGSGYQRFSGELLVNIPQTPQLVFGASGGAVCYKRPMLDDIGLLDEQFFFNNEDVDISFRAQLAGYKCLWVPDAIVYHQGSATSQRMSDMALYHIHRNKEWVFFKNMPTRLLWKYLPLHLLYSALWFISLSIKGRSKIIWQAKRDAWRGRHLIKKSRVHIQTKKRVSNDYIDQCIDKRALTKIKNFLLRKNNS